MKTNINNEAISKKLTATFKKGSCNRVLLLNPPQFPSEVIDISMAKNLRYFANPPYGIGLLTSKLLSKGYEVNLLDINYEILFYIHTNEENLINIDSLTDSWKEKLKQKIESFKPDIIGISCMFTTIKDMKEVSSFVKSCDENLPVFAGGASLIHNTESILRDCESIDFISLFEGDIVFSDYLDFVNGKLDATYIKQIATIIDNKYIAIEERSIPKGKDIDSPPNYLNLPIEKYSSFGEIGAYRFWRAPNAKVATAISNRGCSGHCSFCGVRSFNGPGVRSRDINAVADEIESMKQNYGISHIMWLDDDLFFNEKRAIRLFDEIARRKLNITWDATNGVIAAEISDELIDIAVKSGCIGLNIGIESGNPYILRKINKPSTIDDFKHAAKILNKYQQIFTKGFLIIGFPDETLNQIQDTINFAKELALDWYTVQSLCPFPATKIYSEILEKQQSKKDSSVPTMLEYGSSHMGTKRLIERKQKKQAKDFYDLFEENLEIVPEKEIMNDVWFLTDYRINYEILLKENSHPRLIKFKRFLSDIADRITSENPLANLFLGIVEKKLGNLEESDKRKMLSKGFLDNSDFWSKRFIALGLDKLY